MAAALQPIGSGLALIHISEPTRRTPISSSSAASDVYKRQPNSASARRAHRVQEPSEFIRSIRPWQPHFNRLVPDWLLYTSPSPRDGLLYPLRRQRQMCIRDSQTARALGERIVFKNRLNSSGVFDHGSRTSTDWFRTGSYTHLRAHETDSYILFVGSVRCV